MLSEQDRRGRMLWDGEGSAVSDQTSRNKRTAMAFYDLMFN